MNRAKLGIAVSEAKRFIDKAKAYQRNPPTNHFAASKEGSAVKRASMDLTRALSDLRKPS